jgi:hypothetical protein
MSTQRPWIALAACTLVLASPRPGQGDEPTFQQQAEAKRIARELDRAAELQAQGALDQSAGYWLKAQRRLVAYLGNADAQQSQLVSESHRRLAELGGELAPRIADLPDVPYLPSYTPPAAESTADTPSARVTNDDAFATQVAPILVEKCGRCHIEQRRGRLSLTTFDEMQRHARLVVAGQPAESLLVSAIESGAMPKRGAKVTPEELSRIREWIQSGANLRDSDRTRTLAQLTGATVSAGEQADDGDAPAMPNESEVVSFSNHIAPVLVDACATCHIDRPQVRGGLSLASYEALMRGGDNGPAVMANRGEDSLLIKKLRGTAGGQRMPAGGNPLDDKVVALLARWIDQGAQFDGGGPAASLRDLVARGIASKASHEELARQRRDRAIANWQLVMGGQAPTVQETATFVVLAPDASSKPEPFAEAAESIAGRIATQLRHPVKEPLIKGKIAAYLFKVRYDYGEFGKMIERREISRDWFNHWGNNQVDAYIVFHWSSDELSRAKPWLARDIAAAYVAGLAADVPKWFANGIGYSTADKLFGDEEIPKLWRQKSVELTAKMSARDDFISGKLNDDDAGLVGFQFIEFLKQANGKSFNKLLSDLRESVGFERAFATAFGATPAELLQSQPAPSRQ